MYVLNHAFDFFSHFHYEMWFFTHMLVVLVKCLSSQPSDFWSILFHSSLQVSVRNVKVVGSEIWNLMREGEAEKQVICNSACIHPFFCGSLLYLKWDT